MKQVDFYLIQNRVRDSRIKFACRLANKLLRLNNKVFIQTANQSHTDQLDDFLWSFSDTSFVPHETIQADSGTEVSTSDSYIHIGHHYASLIEPVKNHYQVLINLDDNLSTHDIAIDRLVEIVAQDENEKQLARQRYRAYQQQGIEIKTHNLEL